MMLILCFRAFRSLMRIVRLLVPAILVVVCICKFCLGGGTAGESVVGAVAGSGTANATVVTAIATIVLGLWTVRLVLRLVLKILRFALSVALIVVIVYQMVM
ncbi:MAG: hypothetical protein LBH06_04220 [Rikenellaceae bacterium]|nr:hypothetical protein [Rikenellaceae bacterium]